MPNVIRFACPSCHADVSAGPQYAGLSGPCPACKAIVAVPKPPAPPPPPPQSTEDKTLITTAAWVSRLPSSGPS